MYAVNRTLSREEKIFAVKNSLRSLGRIIVAFSGGVDSSVLLKLSVESVGKENVIAVTATGDMYPSQEKARAKRIASLIGINHIFCENPAVRNPEFLANTNLRCYHCKKAVMGYLKTLAAQRGFDAVVAGENADDVSDYRPGHKAIEELGIVCPLKDAGLTKAEIRTMARDSGLPNWNAPAGPCLVTRIAYGQVIDLKLLRKIDEGEMFLRDLGFDIVRLRVHDKVVRIEVPPAEIRKLIQGDLRERIMRKLKELGFTYVSVDLTGYRMGSLNEMLKDNKDNNIKHGR